MIRGQGCDMGGNQLKRKLTRFFRAYNFSNIWYSIIREFCSHRVRKFAEAGWKICKIDQCGSVFLAVAICCTFSWRGSICWREEIVHWGELFDANGIFKILHNPDWWQHVLLSVWVFLVKFGFNFYLGLFMGSLKCKFLFSLTAIEWDRRVVIN